MNEVVTKFGPVIGRTLVVLIFLISGINKISGFDQTAGWMASKGLPMVQVLLILTIFVEIAGSAMVILGWKARLGATALFLFTVLATLIFHQFWIDPKEFLMFWKNVSIAGALLYIMAFGSGRFSLGK